MSTKGKRPRQHTPEFKVEVVRLMKDRLAAGVSLQRVSEELELGPDLLRVWAKQVAAAPNGATPKQIFPGPGRRRGYQEVRTAVPDPRPLTPEQELARLRRENERLRQERDFLKKAAAFFAKESR
jgi:transposase-like protein